MAIPAWFWPPSSNAARGIALAPLGAGMAVADWTTPTVWPFSGSVFSSGIVLVSGTPGLAGLVADTASGAWAVAFGGSFWHLASGGTVSASGVLPTGRVYVGAASPNGSGVFASSDGAVWTSGGASIGTWPTSARSLTWSGTTLAALLPASGVGLMNATNGVSGLIAFPATIPTGACLTVASGWPLGLAGWQTAPTLSGASAAALDPQTPTLMAAVGSGFALLWSAPGALADAWSQSQTLTGLANLTALAWRPDGLQILGCSLVSGAVQVIASGSLLSLAQTVSISGACSVAVASDSAHALVAQSGQSQIATLVRSGSTWASGTPITGFPGIVAVVPFDTSGVAAIWTSGMSLLALSGSTWSVASSAATSFAPTCLAVDSFNQVYVAGSGSLTVFSGTASLGSGAWSGAAPTAVAVQQGRVVLAVPGDSLLRVFGLSSPSTWTQQYSAALSQGATVGLGLSQTTLFALGSGSTVTWGFSGTPYELTPVLFGAGATWNGASWATGALGVGHSPSCCTLDASGNLLIATSQNTFWTLTSGAVFSASGIVPQYSGQAQTVPIGPSALLVSGGHVWCATSLPGVLIELE